MRREEFGYESLTYAVDHMKATLLVCDRNRNVVYYNDYVCTALKLPKDVLENANLNDLVAEGYLQNSASAKAFDTKELSICYVHGKSKMQMPLLTVSNPVLDENGEVEMVVAVSFDDRISEMVTHELIDARQKSAQLLDYFAASAKGAENVVAESPSMKRILSMLTRISASDSNILLRGPTGSGKEVLAKFAHSQSTRSDRIFIPVNCAAIPENLMKSEFFGYERGTFTGGNREGKVGIFELADGGTVFLDEIGELSLMLQAKFLRVIETGEVTRLGGATSKKVNFRLIAATHRNLEEMCAEGAFRRDLYYRLNILSVDIPPLRERVEDVAPLAQYFLNKLNKKYAKSKVFSQEVLDWMKQYAWPGNVRELRNVVERLFITSSTDILMTEGEGPLTLPVGNGTPAYPAEQRTAEADPYVIPEDLSLREAVEAYEKQVVLQTIKDCGGSVSKAADRLQLHKSVLYRKLEKYRDKASGDIR